MKTFCSMLFLAVFPLCASANIQPEKENVLTSKIEKVTIYLNGAQVFHTGQASLKQGTNILYLKNISSKVSSSSIHAEFSNNVKILATEYGIDKITSGTRDSARIDFILDTLEIVKKEQRRIVSLIEALASEKSAILSNSNLSGTQNIPVAEIQKLSEFYRIRVGEIHKQIFTLKETEIDLARLMDRYHQKIERLKSVVKTEYYHQMKVVVYSPAVQTAGFNIKYLTGGAAWTPKYDLYAQNVDGGIQLDYNAHVMNQTGENWNDVNIILSTADPLQSHNQPVLAPWLLYSGANLNTQNNRNNGPVAVSREQAQQAYGDLKLLDNVSYEEISLSNASVDFNIKGTFSVPSDSKPYLMEVNSHKLNANFQYYCVPKVDSDAFLMTQITGWEELNLIEGPTNIYFRGTFIGHSNISTQFANDTLNISMGRDNKVIVNRIKLEDKDSKKIIGNNKKETFTYKITVRNTNNSAIRMELLDQIPVSQNSEVTVEVHEISQAEQEPLTGILKWSFVIKPQETKEFKVSFSVKYPKDKSYSFESDSKQVYRRAVKAKF